MGSLSAFGRRLWQRQRFRRAVFTFGLIANLAFIVFTLAYTTNPDWPF